jgi:hypothetical protein
VSGLRVGLRRLLVVFDRPPDLRIRANVLSISAGALGVLACYPVAACHIAPRVALPLKRAVAQGVKLGRPKIDTAIERKVRKQLAKGVGMLKVAKSLGIGTGTLQRISKERAMSLRGAQQ